MIRIFFIIIVLLRPSQLNAHKNRISRLHRSVTENIHQCKHWRIETTDDPHFADVHVTLHNKGSTVKKMSAALRCLTMEKLAEPGSAFSVAPDTSQEVTFRIAVSWKYFHYDPSVRRHDCQLSTWSDDANSLVTCKFNVSVWPNGMFYYKCLQYKKGQLSVSQSTQSTSRQISLYNTEHFPTMHQQRSLYVINSTCRPEVPTLQHVDMYKQLEAGGKWALEFPLSCSGATNLNYHGQCSIEIFHLCREVTTKVKEVKFDFWDGEIEECEHVKKKFGKPAGKSFSAALGVNDEVSETLVIVTIVEILLIIGTLLLKLSVVGFTQGWDSAKKEFTQRFNNLVRRTSSISGRVPNESQENSTKRGRSVEVSAVREEYD